MNESSKAVFLSYASQDAEAAKRIADALRGAGVEVWFDAEGGLEHGDEWDAKIRRQIKECVLFIPLISANTQAREEGYFRLEWDLAAERARTIASGVAFILPVLVDGTKEAEALAPDRFHAVQWTKLPGGNVSPDVLQRFLKLWSHRTGALKQRDAEPVGAALRRDESGHKAPPTVKWALPLIGGAIAVVAIAAWFALRPMPRAEQKPAPVPAANATKAATPAPTDFPKDPDLAKAIALTETLNSTVEDYALAEDLAKAVLVRRPTDPETVIVNAYVENRFILRGFDVSDERHATARRLCERAVLLAPDHPEALHVLGQFLIFRQADLPRAVELLRRAVTLQPDQARFYNSYVEALAGIKAPEAVQAAEAAAARFPGDPIVHYRLALTYAYVPGRLDAYEKALRETIAIGPVATALIRMSTVMMIVHRDIPGARVWLDRLPGTFRLNDRAVFARYMLASASGEPADVDNALRLLGAMPGGFLNDFGLVPKHMLIGDLYARIGKEDVARREYEAALADIAQEEARNSQLKFDRVRKWILAGLGRKSEAKATANLTYATAARPFTLLGGHNTWFGTINTLLLLDERAKAVELLREAVKGDWSRRVLAGSFAIDPHLAPWRDDPEIQGLLAEPAINQGVSAGESAFAKPTADSSGKASAVAQPMADRSLPDEKSVAVLAFANLSDDKANEYFSDGISEELLNVLAKIPNLKVSARTSAFFFKGKEVPIPEIAKQLGVAYVVEGSVRKAGDRVRITAQLIKAADGFHVWSDTFTRDLKDIFAVQDEIAGLIAKNLELKMGMVAARPTIDLEAYQEYLTGRALFAKASNDDLKAAIGHFTKAVAIEPKFTAAWVQLASVHTQLGRWGGTATLQAWPAARAAIDRAIALEPDSPDVLLALGWIMRTGEWNWRGAERAYRRALELRPNHADTLSAAAVLLYNLGHTEEALNLGRQAVQLDPLNAATQIDLSLVFYMSQNWAEHEKLARRAIQLAPTGVSYHGLLAFGLAGQRRFAEAEAEARGETDDVGRLYALGIIVAMQGQGEAARGYRQQLEELSHAHGDTADLQLGIADISGLLGDKDQAFAALGKAMSARDPSVAWFRNDFYLLPLHADPRWDALLRKVGLADDQLK